MGLLLKCFELKATFDSLLRDKGRFAEAIAIQIGGVYSNRIVVGQESDMAPFEVVPYDEQKRAIAAISLSGTRSSINVKTIPNLAKKVLTTSHEISSKMLEDK